MRRVPRVSLTCVGCGNMFEKKACEIKRPGEGRYCSARCRDDAKMRQLPRACEQCGSKFSRKSSESPKGEAAFCSRTCYDASRPVRVGYKKIGATHEHRLVAECKIGRKLLPGEIVHHIDGNRRNNSPENLEVLASQSEHIREHREDLNRAKGLLA